MDKYNVERGGRAGESNKQGGFSCGRGRKKKIMSHTRESCVRQSFTHGKCHCVFLKPLQEHFVVVCLLTRLTFTTSRSLVVFLGSGTRTATRWSETCVLVKPVLIPICARMSCAALRCRKGKGSNGDNSSGPRASDFVEIMKTCDNSSQVSSRLSKRRLSPCKSTPDVSRRRPENEGWRLG